MATLKEEKLVKNYNEESEESSEPKKESMNEEEFKKETDTATKIFGINSTINSTKRAILNAIKAGIENLKTEINLDKYVSTITTSKIGMNLYFETLYEYPELFYADLTVSCTYYTNSSGAITRFSLKVKYLYNAATTRTMKSYLNTKVNEIKNKYLYNASSLLDSPTVPAVPPSFCQGSQPLYATCALYWIPAVSSARDIINAKDTHIKIKLTKQIATIFLFFKKLTLLKFICIPSSQTTIPFCDIFLS